MIKLGSSMVVALGVLATPAAAREAKPLPTSPMVGSLEACQKIAEDSARLACFDKAAGAFVTAARAGNVTVVDRASVQRARRSLFGFASSAFSFLGDKSEGPERLDSKIVKTLEMRNGFFQFTIAEDNAVWQTTEASYLREPKPGETIAITRGALGSYWAKIGKQRDVKVKRVR